MIVPDVAVVAAIVRDVARREIMPRFRSLAAHQIREKSPGNLVTEADVEAEKALESLLTALLPGSLVVGEEAASEDAGVLDALKGEAPVWVLDPVDGTNNFAHGRPTFGVIVALVQGGRTVAGWIHDPVADVTATTALGQGSWIGERRLTAAAAAPLAEMTGSLGYRRSKMLADKTRALLRQGSVAHDYLGLADGSIHFAYYTRLAPWDHAAGILMFQEAGGFAAMIDGGPYTPLPAGSGVLLAPDPTCWNALRPHVED